MLRIRFVVIIKCCISNDWHDKNRICLFDFDVGDVRILNNWFDSSKDLI